RWFPFHEYAADRATYEIKLRVPKGVVVAGYSEQPVVELPIAPVGEPAKPDKAKTTPAQLPGAQINVPTAPAVAPPMVSYTFISTKPILPGNFAAAKSSVNDVK